MRASKPVRCSISLGQPVADPAEAHVAELVDLARSAAPSCPPTGVAPSATTTIEKFAPRSCRCVMRSQTSSMSNGSSGTRMMSAPPASPEYVAIQPAWRPITSTTITRSWLSAVVCRRSIASVAICTAVWNPNVKSVAERSLSIVFGTPTTLHAVGRELVRDTERVLAADRDQRVDAVASRASPSPAPAPSSVLYGFVRDVPRIVPPRGSSPRTRPTPQVDRLAVDHARASRGGSR